MAIDPRSIPSRVHIQNLRLGDEPTPDVNQRVARLENALLGVVAILEEAGLYEDEFTPSEADNGEGT